MIIAIDTKFSAGNGSFTVEYFSRLAKKHPQHQFIYIAEKNVDEKLTSSGNIKTVVVGPEASSSLLRQYRYNYKIPAALRKYKADVFVCTAGICSLRTKIPQCLIIQDLSFLYTPQFFPKDYLRYYKKFMPKFLLKAKNIITVSHFSRLAIIEKYKTGEKKIDTVYPAVSESFKPIDESVKEQIKEKYTEGKEYFLYSGVIHPRKNLVMLLKAFSFFKKRQKSNMQLVITGQGDGSYEEFTTGLKTFKFRDEVKLLGSLPQEELILVTAAAYAFVYPSLYEDFALPPLQAMQCGVPVIASNTGALPEICDEAALYANPSDFNDIAEKMMLLFKDENIKKELGEKGILRAQQFNLEKAIGLVWLSVLKCAGPVN